MFSSETVRSNAFDQKHENVTVFEYVREGEGWGGGGGLGILALCISYINNRKQQTIGYCILLRGTIVNRTYGIHKTLYIYLFLLTIFGPVNYGPP